MSVDYDYIRQIPCEVVHVFRCCVCGETCEEKQRVSVNQSAYIVPRPPWSAGGWRSIEGLLICPKHELQITARIDGRDYRTQADYDELRANVFQPEPAETAQ